MTNAALRLSAVLLALVCLASCSSDKRSAEKPSASQPSAAASQPAATPPPTEVQQTKSAAVAPEAAGQKPSGPPAKDKYQFGLTNYAKVPVTVSLNGEWLGQWDSSNSVPIQPVQGKNQLTVEVAGQPINQLTVEVQATRDGQNIRIFSANAQAGSHTTRSWPSSPGAAGLSTGALPLRRFGLPLRGRSSSLTT